MLYICADVCYHSFGFNLIPVRRHGKRLRGGVEIPTGGKVREREKDSLRSLNW